MRFRLPRRLFDPDYRKEIRRKKMEKKSQELIEMHNYLMNWHYHFTWLPLRIRGSSFCWLETVWRRFNTCVSPEGYKDPEFKLIETTPEGWNKFSVRFAGNGDVVFRRVISRIEM